MIATAAATSQPLLHERLALGGLALVFALSLPIASNAGVTADLEIDFSSAVVVDKGGLEDAGNFSEQTLAMVYLEVAEDVRTAVIKGLTLPNTEGAAHEHYEFDFESSPGVFSDSIDIELYWDLVSGHAISEVVTMLTSFFSFGETLASADYDFFLTTDETGEAFGDDPLPTICGTNLIEVGVTGLPFSLGDGGDVSLVSVACPVVNPGHMNNYATSVVVSATVPEPESGLLGLAALSALGLLRRNREVACSA
jgi:hypothetical protein